MKFSVTILLIALILTSCVKEDYSGSEPNNPSRTVLVYLAGDNNLSIEISATVEAIRRGWKYSGNRCLIYIDAKDATSKLLNVHGGCKGCPKAHYRTPSVPHAPLDKTPIPG